MNYAALSAAIQAYTENPSSDFVAQIPVFVQQAEQRIYNDAPLLATVLPTHHTAADRTEGV